MMFVQDRYLVGDLLVSLVSPFWPKADPGYFGADVRFWE